MCLSLPDGVLDIGALRHRGLHSRKGKGVSSRRLCFWVSRHQLSSSHPIIVGSICLCVSMAVSYFHMLQPARHFHKGNLSFSSYRATSHRLAFASMQRSDRNIAIDPKIIYLGKLDGPTCHTGSETCYYTSVFDLLKQQEAEGNRLVLTSLYALESTISQRKAELAEGENGKPSWTKRLLLSDKLLCSKIREEANDLCQTLENNEDKSRTASEMADVLYHVMVLLALKDVKVEDVLQVLRQRFSQSGIEEKKSRASKNSEED